MVQFIGNSIHFNGKGILDGKLVLPNQSGVIGNGSLFKAFLPFSAGVFANTSDRYITAKNPTTGLYEITGPFGTNVLATKNIGGDTYGQFEQTIENICPDSNQFLEATTSWYNQNVTPTYGYTDPLGGSTASRVLETAATGAHRIINPKTNFTPDGSSYYTFSLFVQAIGRRYIYLDFTGGFPSCTAIFDLQTGAFDSGSGTIYNVLDLGGYYFISLTCQSNAASASNCRIYFANDSKSLSYAGDVTKGFYFWGAKITKESYVSSPIITSGSTVTRSPDYFYFPSSAIPTWMKSKFTMKLIPNYDIPLTTEDKPLWSFNKTASTLVTGYGQHGIAVTDTYIYWCNWGASKIQRCDLDGSNVTDLVTGASSPYDLTITATEIFWTTYNAGKVQKAPIGGGSITDVQTGLGTLRGICNDGTDLIWTAAGNQKIQKCPIAGGSVTDIATGIVSLSGIATDGTTIYYGTSTALYSLPIGGGTPTTLATGQSVLQIVNIDDNFVYWGNYGSDQVRVISKKGGAVANLADLTGVASVGINGGTLFYMGSASGGTLVRRDSVTAWLTTTGTIKVVDGPDTKVETSAATASMHDNLEVEFDRVNGKITLSGFTTGDGEYTDTAWSDPDGFDIEYGCALGGAAQSDALVTVPKG